MPEPSALSQRYPDITRVPAHVAIIMDGNGRWARARGWPRIAGHRAGTDNIRRVLRAASDFGIEVLTVYAFSTENWQRPTDEVSGLMRLMSEFIQRYLRELHANNVQIRHCGRLTGVAPRLRDQIREALDLTRDNTGIILNVAFNYGGRAEIGDAVRRIMQDGYAAEAVTEELIGHYLYTAGLPDPDLIIRTGGEYRTSNFLIWQAAYAEYYATAAFWPDFGEAELAEALATYGRRERRFGKVPAAKS